MTKNLIANGILKSILIITSILIGPEGDFSENEIKLASSKGFKNVSLGDTRLRSETAGIIACHTVSIANM